LTIKRYLNYEQVLLTLIVFYRIICKRVTSSNKQNSNPPIVSSKTLSANETLTNEANVSQENYRRNREISFLDLLDWNYFDWYASTEFSDRL
jgi:hypothetical protein